MLNLAKNRKLIDAILQSQSDNTWEYPLLLSVNYLLTDLLPLSALLFSFWYGLTMAKKQVSKVLNNRKYSSQYSDYLSDDLN